MMEDHRTGGPWWDGHQAVIWIEFRNFDPSIATKKSSAGNSRHQIVQDLREAMKQGKVMWTHDLPPVDGTPQNADSLDFSFATLAHLRFRTADMVREWPRRDGLQMQIVETIEQEMKSPGTSFSQWAVLDHIEKRCSDGMSDPVAYASSVYKEQLVRGELTATGVPVKNGERGDPQDIPPGQWENLITDRNDAYFPWSRTKDMPNPKGGWRSIKVRFREDIIQLWPGDGKLSLNKIAGASKKLKDATDRKIHCAISKAYANAEAKGLKAPNVVEIRMPVKAILKAIGYKAGGNRITELAGDPRHDGHRGDVGVRVGKRAEKP
jgi:hypothetical protein